MGSSIGPAFNYLLTGTAGGSTLAATLAVVDSGAELFDGWVTDRSCASQFVIGRTGPGDEATAVAGLDALVTLGAARTDENYEIPCYIQCFVGGTDQSEARYNALALWDAWVHWLSLDRTLGGALGTMWAEIGSIQITGTPVENTDKGRFCVITFSLRCKNMYYP